MVKERTKMLKWRWNGIKTGGSYAKDLIQAESGAGGGAV